LKTFPGLDWARISADQAGFSGEGIVKVKTWLDEHPKPEDYRLVVVRGGRVVCELYSKIDPQVKLPIASAAKTIYANILGIAIGEERLPGLDARVIDYYPEMMDVPPGKGPKEGRYAFEKDREITFAQLISNTSGYMKPGEVPGKVFHYQTYGMNILTHALAKIYGYYDSHDPQNSPGFGRLVGEKIALPIGAAWDYHHTNFDLHADARLNIFGNYCQVYTNPLDFARLGWLWCCWGCWGDRQVIPEDWLRASVQVAPDILANCPPEQWQYGYGTWTNAKGRLAPDLPRELFTAAGAGGHYLSVYPSQELVIVQNPGPYSQGDHGNFELQKIVLDAIER
jgi:CubicO group peptidase (beta-lactamase class C family)